MSYLGNNVPGMQLPKGVRTLLWVTGGMYILQLVMDGSTGGMFSRIFALWPADVAEGKIWQLFTYMFLHDRHSVFHLFMNLLWLFFMGPETERALGLKHFYSVYFISGILGGLGWALVGDDYAACVGASGALFGILGAFVALYPNRLVYIIFLPMFPFRAWVFALVIAFVQLAFLLSHSGGNIAYGVHLIGGIVGYIYTLVLLRPEQLRFLKQKIVEKKESMVDQGLSEAELDHLLDKIAKDGIQSLSRKEREQLQRASKQRKL